MSPPFVNFQRLSAGSAKRVRKKWGKSSESFDEVVPSTLENIKLVRVRVTLNPNPNPNSSADLKEKHRLRNSDDPLASEHGRQALDCAASGGGHHVGPDRRAEGSREATRIVFGEPHANPTSVPLGIVSTWKETGEYLILFFHRFWRTTSSFAPVLVYPPPPLPTSDEHSQGPKKSPTRLTPISLACILANIRGSNFL